MSNHNPKFISPPTTYHLPPTKRGFTLVEMLIVAPIIILVIGVFISAIISMTGDVLAVRGKNAMTYDIQGALSSIDQDIKYSGGYLATNNITLTSPQGYNDDSTSNFHNADATNGTSLILNTYATTTSPLSSSRNYIYVTDQPNACASPLVSQNSKVMVNVIYFVKNNILWRRVVMPSSYATVGCSVPWQQPTCTPDYNPTTYPFCKTKDTKLVDGIEPDDFKVDYFTAADTVNKIVNASDSSLADSVRQTALQTASSIKVTVTSSKTMAGRDVSQSGTIRSISPNGNIAATSAILLSNSNGGSWLYKRPITVTNSSGATLSDYQLQIMPFTDPTFVNNTGLVGSWHMNGSTSGSIANGAAAGLEDMSGNNNNGTASNANGSGMAWTAGKFAGATTFDGVDDYVSTTNSPTLGFSNAVTVEAWIYTPTPTPASQKTIICRNALGGGAPIGFNLNLETDGRIRFWASPDGSTSDTAAYSSSSIQANTWTHIVGVVNGTSNTVYLNAVAGSPTVRASGIVYNGTQNVFIGGASTAGWYFSGKIDEAKVYNRALSASEISARYGTAGVPKISGDYADVRFANSTGKTEYSYWQETDGKYWVKIPSLATGDTTINMYYSNPVAVSSSSGDNTFIFYDNFESGNLNKWNAKAGTPLIGSAYAYSGGYGGRSSSTSCNENSLVHTFSSTAISSVIAEYRRLIANGYSYGGITGPLGTDARYIGAALSAPTSYTIYDSAYNAATSASVTTWRKYKVSASPTATTYYTDGVQIPFTTSRAGTFQTLILYACSAGGYSNFDDVVVRKYASTEPTHSAPGAETSP